jgi:TonB family protein
MPNWKPGKQNGQPVKTYYTLPVSFSFRGQAGDTIADARDYLTPKPPPPAPPVVPDSERIYVSVERMPQYPGGFKALIDFLSENIRYPQEAKKQNIQGRVIVQFVVDKDGSVTNAEIKRDIGGGCGEEALRVLSIMPKWQFGMQNNIPVRVYYTLPISFKLGK